MNIKCWTTKRIKEVLAENFTRGINGKDYEDIKEELEAILWEREKKEELKEEKKRIKEEIEYEKFLKKKK